MSACVTRFKLWPKSLSVMPKQMPETVSVSVMRTTQRPQCRPDAASLGSHSLHQQSIVGLLVRSRVRWRKAFCAQKRVGGFCFTVTPAVTQTPPTVRILSVVVICELRDRLQTISPPGPQCVQNLPELLLPPPPPPPSLQRQRPSTKNITGAVQVTAGVS